MNNRYFNTIMPSVNEQWAARVLNMTWNSGNGPDLFDDKKIVEAKFLNQNYLDSINYAGNWTTFDFQLDYSPEKARYWALGTYTLSIPISRIWTRNRKRLEGYVTERELNIVDWTWMQQFPPHEVKGQTQRSQWHHIFRYAKRAKLPPIISAHQVEKGTVFLTHGVNPEDFDLT